MAANNLRAMLLLAGALALADPAASQSQLQPLDAPAAAAPPAQANALALRLTCDVKRRSDNAAAGSAATSGGDKMDIDIANATARVRVPKTYLPPWHGGTDSWFDVKDLVTTDDAITGTVLINFARHPKLRVDRHTGAVELTGNLGTYQGQCRPYDTTQRAF
jgi:hypothetical protein